VFRCPGIPGQQQQENKPAKDDSSCNSHRTERAIDLGTLHPFTKTTARSSAAKLPDSEIFHKRFFANSRERRAPGSWSQCVSNLKSRLSMNRSNRRQEALTSRSGKSQSLLTLGCYDKLRTLRACGACLPVEGCD
jgi:hypothetical protein